jgi:hypothetical protein
MRKTIDRCRVGFIPSVERCQKRISESSPPVAIIFPSGLKSAVHTGPPWLIGLIASFPEATSHSRAVLSSLADIAVGQTERPLQIEGRKTLPSDHACLETRCVGFDGVDH